ncbi:MAG: hypothetical protein KF729_33580 [Sandaracinaceae bacterium]|nr:hypothetical protein [Sandaracinaceae bacterium]
MTTRRRHQALYSLFGGALLALALACGGSGDDDDTTSASSGESAPASVLSRVEALAPATDSASFEVYERQLQSNELVQLSRAAGQPVPSYLREYPLPPTLTDVLMHDFRLTASVDLSMGTIDRPVTAEQMTRIIAFYVETPDSRIRGLRPVAHKRFITGLTDAERAQLATEAAAHVNANGFFGPTP